jgi:porphobilinogen deaminase
MHSDGRAPTWIKPAILVASTLAQRALSDALQGNCVAPSAHHAQARHAMLGTVLLSRD